VLSSPLSQWSWQCPTNRGHGHCKVLYSSLKISISFSRNFIQESSSVERGLKLWIFSTAKHKLSDSPDMAITKQRWPSDLSKTSSETVPSDSRTTHIGGQIMERSAELHFFFPEKKGSWRSLRSRNNRLSQPQCLDICCLIWGLTKGSELASPTVIKGIVLILSKKVKFLLIELR